MGMTFYEYATVPVSGTIAQQAFWYTAFVAEYAKAGTKIVDDKGLPKWRVAPSPHGAYWKQGMKLGYQDAGSWLLLKSTPPDRRKAAWLYAQFVVSKTVDTKKSHVGLTFIRNSTVNHKSFTERAPQLGGLVEFYRSPARVAWTPTGTNVPDYPKLSQLWWRNISTAISGEKTVQEALDGLAKDQDEVMHRLERAGVQKVCGPKLNPEESAETWFARAEASDDMLAPQRKLANEKPQGETVVYEDLLAAWSNGKVMP
jgi:glycerol transport system substrate-binding protein